VTFFKRILPLLLVLALALPNTAFAQRLRMTPPNSPTAVTAQANAANANDFVTTSCGIRR